MRGDFYMGLAIGRNLDLHGGIEVMRSDDVWELPIDADKLRREGLPPGRDEKALLNRHLQIWGGLYAEISTHPEKITDAPHELNRDFGEEQVIRKPSYDLTELTIPPGFDTLAYQLGKHDVCNDLIDAFLGLLIHKAETGQCGWAYSR
jgi:hypothetical protein